MGESENEYYRTKSQGPKGQGPKGQGPKGQGPKGQGPKFIHRHFLIIYIIYNHNNIIYTELKIVIFPPSGVHFSGITKMGGAFFPGERVDGALRVGLAGAGLPRKVVVVVVVFVVAVVVVVVVVVVV